MPVFRNRLVLELVRGARLFLSLEAGLTRGGPANPEQRLKAQAQKLHQARSRIERMRNAIAEKDSQLARYRESPLEQRLLAALGGDPQEEAAPRTLPDSVREAMLNLKREVEIARVSEESAGRFRGLEGKRDLKLHLGAGADVRSGWVNIDLFPEPVREMECASTPDTLLIDYDLRRGLPVEEGSCSYIYSSHFFEHLEYRHGLRLLRDCYRALRPGGVFRVSLPAFKNMFDAYVRDEEAYFEPFDIFEILPELEPGTEALVDHIDYGVYQFGEHKRLYDEEKVIRLLRKVGYTSVFGSEYEEGIDPSNEIRRRYSFYVEASK